MTPEEQKEKLKTLKKKAFKKTAIAVFLYVGFLFFANMVTALVDLMYVHNASFVFFMTLGTTVVVFVGLHGTCDEIYRESMVEAQKIVNEVRK